MGPGLASGGAILERTFILLRGGMVMTIAWRDFACAVEGEEGVVRSGARVNESDRCCWWWCEEEEEEEEEGGCCCCCACGW